MQIYVDLIPRNARIVGGQVDLKINEFSKEFVIPPQSTDATFSAANPNDRGIYIFATNTMP
jgi:hypothetical protein